ncbi:MAG: DsrE family protein [Fimbriimonadia bacterium]
MKVLFVINDSPYGNEKAFNAFRLHSALRTADPTAELRVFLLSDGVYCAIPQHQRPEGSYDIEAMLTDAIAGGTKVLACATCLDHRGLWGHKLIAGVEHATMKELSEWTLTSDRVVTF